MPIDIAGIMEEIKKCKTTPATIDGDMIHAPDVRAFEVALIGEVGRRYEAKKPRPITAAMRVGVGVATYLRETFGSVDRFHGVMWTEDPYVSTFDAVLEM